MTKTVPIESTLQDYSALFMKLKRATWNIPINFFFRFFFT